MATPIVLKKPLKVYKVGTAKTLGIFISYIKILDTINLRLCLQ